MSLETDKGENRTCRRSTAVTVVLILSGTILLLGLLLIGGIVGIAWFSYAGVRESASSRDLEQQRKVAEQKRIQAEQDTAVARTAVAHAEAQLASERLERRQRSQTIQSPDQGRQVYASVNTDTSDLTTYLGIRVNIEAPRGTPPRVIQTQASVLQSWALGWHGDDTVILQTRDHGLLAWKEGPSGTWEPLRHPFPEELRRRGLELLPGQSGRTE